MNFGIRELVFMLVLLAMPVSSWYFVFRPQNSEIQEAKKEIEQKELMLDKLAAATEQTDDLERANAEVAESIEHIESRLPGSKEVDVVLNQVYTLARDRGLELPEVRSGKPVPSAKFMEQPLEMICEGNFDAFYQFVLDVEKLDRITRMPDLQIERINDLDGNIEAQFTLSIYFQPESKEGSS